MAFGSGAPSQPSPTSSGLRKRATLLPFGVDEAGGIVPAVPQLLVDAYNAAQFPGQVYRGEKEVFDRSTGHVSDEAISAANGIAGTAMTGSLPFSAPKGALRSFGGAAAKDDPLAALEAGLSAATKDMEPYVTPRSFVDPAAKSWDLYHGTAAPEDFARFRTDLPEDLRPHTNGSQVQSQAVFLSPAPDEAAHYALSGGKTGEGNAAGPRTMRVTVDPGKTGLLDMIELAQQPGFVDRVYANRVAAEGNPTDPDILRGIRYTAEQLHRSTLDKIASTKAFNEQYGHLGVSEVPTYNYFGGGTDIALQMARERGLDTAVIRGLSESNGGDQVVALTPGRVRSFYDPSQVLYSGGPAGAGVGAAAAMGGGNARSADISSKGNPPMGFGFGQIPGVAPGVTPDDIMRLIGRGRGTAGQPSPAPFGFGSLPPPQMPQGAPSPAIAESEAAARQAEASMMPSGFGGTPLPPSRPPGMGYDPLVAENEAATRAAEMQTGMVPQAAPARAPRPLSFGAPVQTASAPAPSPQYLPDDAPLPSARVPLPPPRPAGFGFGPASTAQADMPVAGGVPASFQGAPGAVPPAPGRTAAETPASPGFSLSSVLGALGNPRVQNMLAGYGAGLSSTPGFGAGMAAGTKLTAQLNTQTAAQDLAQSEYALKTQKLRQEQGGANATFDHLIRLGHAPEKVQLAMAAYRAGQNEPLNNLLKTAVPAPQQPSIVEIEGQKHSLLPGQKPSADTLLGRAGASPQMLRENAQASAEGAAAGKPDETYTQLPESERVARNYPAGAYQVDSKGKVSAVNPSGQIINMNSEKAQDATVGKGYGEYQLDLATKGRNAGSTLNTLALMEQAARDPNFYSGVGAEGLKRVNQLMVSLGVKDASFTKPTEVFEALSNKVVLDSLGGSLGPGISNTDRDYLGRVAPGLSRTREGNLELIGIARSLAQRQQQVARLARDYAAARNGRLDAGFDDVLADFSEKNPLFPAASAVSTAQPVGATGTGSMAAPDRSAIDAELRRRGLR